MTLLPNSNAAVLDVHKLEDYCLSSIHPRGRHKARVFRQALGIDRDQATWLRRILLEAVQVCEAAALSRTGFGQTWRVDCPIARHGRNAVVRTIWIVKNGDDRPQFVTCWIL
ncbi:DUF6883 domain-containing protein [Astrobacterium formosum]|uniref:DUF6883 domain-containing protein n=1 Tax=Astrobacterium formosum TaxID=3069710 RepID=UPI003F4F6882